MLLLVESGSSSRRGELETAPSVQLGLMSSYSKQNDRCLRTTQNMSRGDPVKRNGQSSCLLVGHLLLNGQRMRPIFDVCN